MDNFFPWVGNYNNLDDVTGYSNLASFPTIGEKDKIYIALDTDLAYVWTGSAYVEISPAIVTLQQAFNSGNTITIANSSNKNFVLTYNDTTNNLSAVSLVNAGTGNTLDIDANGNVGTNVATNGALHIENTGNTGIALSVYTNIGAAAAPLVYIKANNTAFDQTVFKIDNNATGTAATMTIASAAINASYVVNIASSGTTTKTLYVNATATVNRNTLHVNNSAVFTGTTNTSHVYFNLSNASSSGDVLCLNTIGTGRSLYLSQQGAGNAILADHDDTGTNPTIYVDRDGNNASKIWGLKIDTDNAGAGGVGAIDLSSFSTGEANFKFVADANDPTAGGGAAVGRIAIDIGGSIKYIAYY